MTSTALAPAPPSVEGLEQAVLAVLRDQVLAEAKALPGGCLVHPTGRVRWLGAVFSVRRVLYETEFGALPSGVMLKRTCATAECVEHYLAQSREEWGRFLGKRAGAWRPAQTG